MNGNDVRLLGKMKNVQRVDTRTDKSLKTLFIHNGEVLDKAAV